MSESKQLLQVEGVGCGLPMHTTVGGAMLGVTLGAELGAELGTELGTELATKVGSKVGPELGTPVGAGLFTASSGAGQPPLLTLNGFTLTLVEVSGQKSQRPQVTGQIKAKSPAQPLRPAFDATSKQKADAAQDSGQEE